MRAPGIRHVAVRTILNSGGGPAAEAEVVLEDGSSGLGSAPTAIKPGKRERPTSRELRLGSPVPARIESAMAVLARAPVRDQETLDNWLEDRLPDLGTDVTLAVSLAYARGMARSSKIPLYRYLAVQARMEPALPGLLAALVSGGLHQPGGMPFQQIMLAADVRSPSEAIPIIVEIHRQTESALRENGLFTGYSASSGMTVTAEDPAVSLEIVSGILERLGLDDRFSLTIDVAAEHLWVPNGYRVGGTVVDEDGLGSLLDGLLSSFPITVVEDPFCAVHTASWSALRRRHADSVEVVGDDLFATNAAHIDPALADGIVLKMNQVGTVTSTLRAAREASGLGMRCCVSHRSLETEDTALCDLAVAVGAGWLKIGGPRRGDRTAKYNRMLRLERMLEQPVP